MVSLGQVWYLSVSIPDLCRLSYCSIPRALKKTDGSICHLDLYVVAINQAVRKDNVFVTESIEPFIQGK